jgi:heptosyltransferase I
MPLLKESPPDAVCIIRLSAIGDCCHTLPVVRTIQSTWPGTKITWIIGRTEYELMKGIEGVEFIIFDKAETLQSTRRIRRQLAGRRFPVLLHMHASMRANLVSRAVRADVRLGFDRARARDYQWLFTNAKIPARPEQHVMDGLFEFIGALGITERILRWDIPIEESDRSFARKICDTDRPICVISPCTSQRQRNYRNWSAENYSALANYLRKNHGAQIILTGGPTELEREYGAQIESNVSTELVNLIGRSSLKQLLAILDQANVLICPDSGPAHMATTVKTPVVGLYATSNRHRTGPYFSQQWVLDQYPQAVHQEFDKPVEALRWGERVRNPDAMSLISLDVVTAMVDKVLSERNLKDSRE